MKRLASVACAALAITAFAACGDDDDDDTPSDETVVEGTEAMTETTTATT